MARKNIYDKDIKYNLLKIYVDWCCGSCYTKAEIRGTENIPTDGAVIFTPNHCNTLMDALVVLRSKKSPTLFGARADIFKKAAKPLHFLRILPMIRQRDGLRNVVKNRDTNKIIVEAMEHGMPFCIFPEGRHRPMHSIMRLGKGTQRIALEAYEKFGDKMPVYIVPAGIEYSDYFRFRCTSTIEFGQAFKIEDVISKHDDEESEAIFLRQIGDKITEGISGLITFIPDDENYDRRWALLKVLTTGKKGSPMELKDLRRAQVKEILHKEEKSPAEMEGIYTDVKVFDAARKKAKISSYSFGKKNLGLTILGKTLFSIISIPYLLFSLVLTFPMWLTAKLIGRGVKDPCFLNTVHFGVKLGMLPILTLIWAIVAFCTLPWYWALAAILLFLPSYSFIYDAKEFARRMYSDYSLLGKKKLAKQFEEIRNRFNAI